MTANNITSIEDIKAARHRMILDAKAQHIDNLPPNADGERHWYPDELPAIISAILGENISAAELQAAERWEWERAAGGKLNPVAAHPGGKLADRIAEYKEALGRLQETYEHLVAHHTISMTAKDRADDIFYDDADALPPSSGVCQSEDDPSRTWSLRGRIAVFGKLSACDGFRLPLLDMDATRERDSTGAMLRPRATNSRARNTLLSALAMP